MIDKSFLRSAAYSTVGFVNHVTSRSLHLRRETIGQRFRINGGTYEIFRDTVSDDQPLEESASVLVVGFRLRLIRSNHLLHWAFQRICILTTPIWSGFPGFRVKLWMVDPRTKNYLGIYEWSTQKQAGSYLNWLLNLLVPLSTRGSVWHDLIPGERLSKYLHDRQYPGTPARPAIESELWSDPHNTIEV